jgi:hypothetical protein
MDGPSCTTKAIQHILSAKSIIVIIGKHTLADPLLSIAASADNTMAGAGVSVAAGIPPFRGDGGIHGERLNGNAVKDLMSIGVMKACLFNTSKLMRH